MEKYDWKVEAVNGVGPFTSFAKNLQDGLNRLTTEGYDVDKLEIKDKGVLLVGKKPLKLPRRM